MSTVINLDKIFDKIEKNVEKVGGIVAALSEESLINLTLRDTGYARSRWQTTKKKDGYLIVNDCEYIVYINDGSKTVKPQKMVERTIKRFPEFVEKAVSKVQ